GAARTHASQLPKPRTAVERPGEEEQRARLRPPREVLKDSLELVEHVMQDSVSPDHVEGAGRDLRGLDRGAYEMHTFAPAVDLGSPAPQRDCARRDIEARDLGSHLGEQGPVQ